MKEAELAAIPQKLIELVRLRSGALPDDVAIIVARRVAAQGVHNS